MIYIDLDGVLCDFVKQCVNIMAPGESDVDVVARGRALVPDQHPFDQFEAALGVENIWGEIVQHGENFWSTMPKLPWADDIIEFFQTKGHDFCFLSSPSWGESGIVACSGKQRWVRDNYGEDLQKRLILCPSKLKCQLSSYGHILIDDLDTNVNEWRRHGGSAFMFPSLQFRGSHPHIAEVLHLLSEVCVKQQHFNKPPF